MEEKLIVLIIMGIITSIIHKRKGYSAITGFLWGAIFFIIGLLIVVTERTKEEQQIEDKGQASVIQWVFIFLGIGVLFMAFLNISLKYFV